ncbi:MAG: DUF6879 family protein [Candidatus Pacearchaeota archaeon]|jgi:hypothetical protein
MDSYFENFEKSAFRLELLQKYSVDEELEDFSNFIKTSKINSKKYSEWTEIISKAKSRGVIMQRVHIVDFPLSDYLKYEFEYYKISKKIGEQIFLLDKNKFNEKVNFDFWLFDDRIVLKMNYDQDGKFLGFEKIIGNVDKFVKLKNKLLKISEEF